VKKVEGQPGSLRRQDAFVTRPLRDRSRGRPLRLQSPITFLIVCFLALSAAAGDAPEVRHVLARRLAPPAVITNHWMVELLHPDDGQTADALAGRFGYRNAGRLLGSDTEFHFIQRAVPQYRMRRSVRHTRQLKSHPMVKRAVQQSGYHRRKRGYREALRVEPLPNDPLFKHQWYLKNNGQAGGKKGLDLNVLGAWALGVTGKNVTTAIMDDGIDYTHPDLMYNYNAAASYDYSSNDPFPYPRYTDTWFNSHGTRCAGEISARRDNHICGVGVAYDSKVAGIRMLDQPYMTDMIEANSMGHEPQLIDIYSASWGPTDDGKTVDGPRNYTMRAIVRGINEGRKGLGSIYVWASGDGGEKDDCNCDGYAASMWTISINSAINDGRTALYDESCSSTLASTFSNGRSANPEAGVATTDLYNSCTLKHSGTSAAAPEAAGVFALGLEANPNLTWRDMQHLTVLTSKRNQLRDPTGRHGWHVNGAGLEFNHLFGYGVLDAGAMVVLAKNWTTGPPRYHCKAGILKGNDKFSKKKPLRLTLDTTSCEDSASPVRYLEHVQAFISLKSSRRGANVVYLTSPMGTRSLILSKRPSDDDEIDGFNKWPFMTTHCWGENPIGRWTLEVMVDPKLEEPHEGFLTEWTLMLHGTQHPPYLSINAPDARSKLAIAKRAHEKMEKMRKRSI